MQLSRGVKKHFEVRCCKIIHLKSFNYKIKLCRYGFEPETYHKTVLNKMTRTNYNTIFVRHPLDKFFAGARAHYGGIAKEDDPHKIETVIDFIRGKIFDEQILAIFCRFN